MFLWVKIIPKTMDGLELFTPRKMPKVVFPGWKKEYRNSIDAYRCYILGGAVLK